MPTTSTIAGITSGSRHRNSSSRLRTGSRRCTHTIVGSSSSSISALVSTASWSEVAIASSSARSSAIDVQAEKSRPPSSPPRVENSSIATSGSRKKAPSSASTP